MFLGLGGPNPASAESAAAAAPARLATAGDFAILAASTITNAKLTTITTGDVGLDPGSSVTGFAPCTPPAPADCVVMTGEIVISTKETSDAKQDALDAYNALLLLDDPACTATNVELANQVLTPGVYCSPGTLGLSGRVTLDAEGDPNAEFIFLTGADGATLITATDSEVLLINGARGCNVYWQVGTSATIGTRSKFAGNIIANTSITMDSRATLDGRALALNGAVTLDNNTITGGACATPAPPGGGDDDDGTPPVGDDDGTPPVGDDDGTPPVDDDDGTAPVGDDDGTPPAGTPDTGGTLTTGPIAGPTSGTDGPGPTAAPPAILTGATPVALTTTPLVVGDRGPGSAIETTARSDTTRASRSGDSSSTATLTSTSAGGGGGFAATGTSARFLTLVAFAAMAVGSLMVLFSRKQTGFGRHATH